MEISVMTGMVLPGFVVLFLVMCVLWLINIRIRNAAIVDFGWGNGFAILTLIYCYLGPGYLPRKLLIASMVVVWGARLALHLLFDRVLSNKPEDGRYVELRKGWKTRIDLKFFFFFQFQTILVVVLSLPFYLMCVNPETSLSVLEWVGAALWLTGLVGESVADRQLKRFKDDPSNRGTTCRAGLWKYSRHPNYFFEWCVWVGYGVAAFPSPYGWAAVVSPLIMLSILLKVTGIPWTEEQAVRTRGDDYREYQRTTSMFVPWFPKK